MIHYLVVGIIDLIFGAMALAKKRNDTTKAFALTTVCIAAWSFELYLLSSLEDKVLLEILFPLFRTGMFLIPPALALLTWRLVGSQSQLFFRWVILPGFALGLALGVANTLFFPTELRPVEHGYLPQADAIYYWFIASFLWCLLASIGMAALQYPRITAREQRKLKWLLITLMLTFVFASAAIFLLAYDFYLSRLIGVMPNLVFVGALSYAVIRHDLMDLRTLVSAGAARACVLILFGLGYFTLISQPSMQSNLASALVAVVFFALLLEAYPRLLRWVQPNTQRLLAASTYDYQQVTEDVHRKLHSCTSWSELKQLLDSIFLQLLGVDHYHLFIAQRDGHATIYTAADKSGHAFRLPPTTALLLRDSTSMIMVDETDGELQQQMAHWGALSCFAIRHRQEPTALLLVGHAKNLASYYRFDDIRLMEWLSKELSQALQRVQILEKSQGELADAKKKLSLLSMMNLYHHDIKAPLSIIDGVVSNDLYDEEKRRQVILEQVAWGSKLITTMAQLLNGGRTLKHQPLSIEKVLRDCAHVFGRTIINLHCYYGETEQIEGDPEDLKILFINVLKNAYEASDKQKALEVHMSTSTDADGVRVEIRDNGVGMPHSQLTHLWSTDKSQKPGGNGIGLQTIKHIADQHHAKISVHSSPGEGTRFIFHFPPLRTREQTAGSAVPAESFLTGTAYPDTH